MLRACGVNYDIRKVDGYGFYPRFKFRVPLGDHGDTYDRLMMRALEMRESIANSESGFRNKYPAGPIMNPKVKIRAFRPPVGEAYGRIEGTERRARLLFDQRRQRESVSLPRAPAEFHQPHHPGRLCLGHTVADVMVILGQHRYRHGRSGSVARRQKVKRVTLLKRRPHLNPLPQGEETLSPTRFNASTLEPLTTSYPFDAISQLSRFVTCRTSRPTMQTSSSKVSR